jgi:hypothetical protein
MTARELNGEKSLAAAGVEHLLRSGSEALEGDTCAMETQAPFRLKASDRTLEREPERFPKYGTHGAILGCSFD